MHCPRCGSENLAVIDSRGDCEAIRRRRECQECEFRFTTFERIERVLPMVVKKDARREAFDRLKIRSGLMKACEKTSVSTESIDQAVDAIENRVFELGVKEIPSRQIGDFLMEALKNLDQVAYVRFASVYREFTDVSQFVDTLQSLEGRLLKKRGSTVRAVSERRSSNANPGPSDIRRGLLGRGSSRNRDIS